MKHIASSDIFLRKINGDAISTCSHRLKSIFTYRKRPGIGPTELIRRPIDT